MQRKVTEVSRHVDRTFAVRLIKFFMDQGHREQAVVALRDRVQRFLAIQAICLHVLYAHHEMKIIAYPVIELFHKPVLYDQQTFLLID